MKGVSRCYVTALANKWGQRDSPKRRLLDDVSSDEDELDEFDVTHSPLPSESPPLVGGPKSSSLCHHRSPHKHANPIFSTNADDCTSPEVYVPPPSSSFSSSHLVLSPKRCNQPVGKLQPHVVDSWTSFKPEKQTSFPGDLWKIPTSSNTPWVDVKGMNDKTQTPDPTKSTAVDTPNDSLRECTKDSNPILVKPLSPKSVRRAHTKPSTPLEIDAEAPLSPPSRNGVKVATTAHSPEEARHSLESLNKAHKAKDSPRRRRPQSPRKQDQTEKRSNGKDKPETIALVSQAELTPVLSVSPRRKKSSRHQSNEKQIQMEQPEASIRHVLQVPLLDGQNDDQVNRHVHEKAPEPTAVAAANEYSPKSPSSPTRPSPCGSSSTARRPCRDASSPKRRVSRVSGDGDFDKQVHTRIRDETRVPKPPTMGSPKKQPPVSALAPSSQRVKSPAKRRTPGVSLGLETDFDVDSTGKTETIMNAAQVSHPKVLTENTVNSLAVNLPEVLESLVIARANSKSIRTMRPIDDDTVTHLDEIMNRVGWTTIVLKEHRASDAAPEDTSAANAAFVTPRVGDPQLVTLMGLDSKTSSLGTSARFEGPSATLDLVPHVVALDDDLDGENSVFHPCPLVLLDVSSDAPKGVSSPPAFPRRRESPYRRRSRTAENLLDCEAFRRKLEASCPTPLQLASYDYSPPKEKEVWRRPLGMTSELDLGKAETNSSSDPVKGAQQRHTSLDKNSGDEFRTCMSNQKSKENELKSRRNPIAGDVNMVSPRKRHSVSTKIGKRLGSHEVKRMHASDSALPMLMLEISMDEPLVSPSCDDTRRRARRLTKEMDADGETHKEQPVLVPRSPVRRRHSTHWRDKTDHASRCTYTSKCADPSDNMVSVESAILTVGGRKQRNGEQARTSSRGDYQVEQPVTEITKDGPVLSASPKDCVCPRTREAPNRRLSASIMQELQSTTKTIEMDPAPSVSPRFSVLRRIAMLSKSSEPSTRTNHVSMSPRPGSRLSIKSSNTMLGTGIGTIDCTGGKYCQGEDDADETGATRSNSPRLFSRASMRIGQLPLTYQSQQQRDDLGCETTNTVAAPSLTYRERRLDALCRVPPRADSKSLENLISVKERLAMFQVAAAKSAVYKKGNMTSSNEASVRSKCHHAMMVGHHESPGDTKAGDETTNKNVVDDDDNSSTVSDFSSPS